MKIQVSGDFGTALQEALFTAGYSYNDFADRAQIASAKLYRILCGERMPTRSAWMRMREALLSPQSANGRPASSTLLESMTATVFEVTEEDYQRANKKIEDARARRMRKQAEQALNDQVADLPPATWALALRLKMEREGLGKAGLAKLIEVPPSRVAAWVAGDIRPSSEEMQALVSVLPGLPRVRDARNHGPRVHYSTPRSSSARKVARKPQLVELRPGAAAETSNPAASPVAGDSYREQVSYPLLNRLLNELTESQVDQVVALVLELRHTNRSA